jgi:hypothetical protein
MPRIICGTLLLVASLLSAQPQRDPSHPPYATPPTFPESKEPGKQNPPDTEAQPNETATSRDSASVKKQIEQAFEHEPLLKDAGLRVAVDDTHVTLKGTVNNEKEREVALSAAALYAGKREIVDQIKIKT